MESAIKFARAPKVLPSGLPLRGGFDRDGFISMVMFFISG